MEKAQAGLTRVILGAKEVCRKITRVDVSTEFGTRTGVVDWHRQLEWRWRRGSTQVIYLVLPRSLVVSGPEISLVPKTSEIQLSPQGYFSSFMAKP